jgi:membrane protease YdiL (CAAX protease family)/ABC-type transport system involved in multi-copper enzyme maturation permease subunit
MNWSILRLLFIHEIKMLVRARRTVVMAIVIPAVIMPVMIYAQKFSNDRRERALTASTYRYAVTGPLADRVRSLIEKTRQSIAENRDEEFDILRQFKFTEMRVANPRASLDNNTIQFYIQAMTGEEADKLPRTNESAPSRPSAAAPQPAKRLNGVPRVTVIYRADRDASDNAHDRMMELLRMARETDSQVLLVDRGFPGNPKGLFAVEDSNIATHGQVTGSLVGRFITLFLVMMMFTGGAVASMDIIAGEKERGTLETLLTTAVRRTEIVTAKLMSITCVALVITLIQGVNFFLYIRLKVIALPKDFDLQLPTGMALTLLALFIPLAATIAAVLLMISAYAKSYKEAQMYFFPVYLVSMIPSLASVMPGISLRSAIALVPLANVSVAAREILMGRPDAIMIFVTFAVMALTAVFLMRISARMLAREDLIIPSHSEPAEFLGGPALFQKRVLRWFALMWAVTFAAAANIPQLATFQRQLLFNEVVIMIGATLLMLKLYNLDIRDALSLRRVKPAVWLAILFAIPSGYLTALAIFRIVNIVIPAPQQLLERFAEDFIPAGMPMWQLYLYIAVLPAVCEEIAFRGMLLNGLRRRLKPVALMVSVGIIFGLFHMTLFRIAPTALLGMILTGIALMTGSIFPGMLMHAGNNAFGLWVGGASLGLETLEWQYYAAAGTIFALSLWIIYRNRTPLPTRPVYRGV